MPDNLHFSNNNPPLIPTVFLHLLCSFIFSHPLYFSYFLFFSPYFIKFISLFSPLFFTTTLLLLLSVLATTFPHSNKLGLVQTVLEKLRSKLNQVEFDEEEQEVCDFEEFEIYKIVFRDVPSSVITIGDGDRMEQVVVMENVTVEGAGKSEEVMSLERLFEELDRFEDSMASFEVKKKETSSDLVEVVGGLQKTEAVEMETKTEKEKLGCKSMAVATETTTISGEGSHLVEVVAGLRKTEAVEMKTEKEKLGGKSMAVAKAATTISGKDLKTEVVEMEKLGGKSMAVVTETTTTTISGEDLKTLPKLKSNSYRLDSCSSFGSYGSMRMEKEWKRTLACKLFEERHNNSEGGEEGMDSLWESYETDHSISTTKSKNKNVNAMVKHKKKNEFKYFDEDDDDDEDEFMNNGQLCCLKALKLSAGKMNLGMGKPNLVKISKAFKGFGWLHHVGTKNGKRI